MVPDSGERRRQRSAGTARKGRCKMASSAMIHLFPAKMRCLVRCRNQRLLYFPSPPRRWAIACHRVPRTAAAIAAGQLLLANCCDSAERSALDYSGRPRRPHCGRRSLAGSACSRSRRCCQAIGIPREGETGSSARSGGSLLKTTSMQGRRLFSTIRRPVASNEAQYFVANSFMVAASMARLLASKANRSPRRSLRSESV